MHFFGGIGFLCVFLGMLAIVLAIILRFTIGLSLILTPLPLFSAFATLMGFQLILIGIIAEMLMRVYYEKNSPHVPYSINEIINMRL